MEVGGSLPACNNARFEHVQVRPFKSRVTTSAKEDRNDILLVTSWDQPRSQMSTTVNPEIAALRDEVVEHGKEIAEIRASLNRLNKIVRANIRQAVWQSIALFISLCVTIVGGLAYQTSVLNNRFEQIEKGWEESDKKFAERSKLSEENLKIHLEQSERTGTARFGNLKQGVRPRRK
jgi:hypothetical protein